MLCSVCEDVNVLSCRTWYVCLTCAISPSCSPCSELFNAAFVSCWMELVTIQKEDLVANLKLALSVPNIPEITQTLLNLAEFMEHCEEASVSEALTEWAFTEWAPIGKALTRQ